MPAEGIYVMVAVVAPVPMTERPVGGGQAGTSSMTMLSKKRSGPQSDQPKNWTITVSPVKLVGINTISLSKVDAGDVVDAPVVAKVDPFNVVNVVHVALFIERTRTLNESYG